MPPPLAVTSVGLAVSPSTMLMSSIAITVEFIDVLVPLTVRLPSIITLPGARVVPMCNIPVGALLKIPTLLVAAFTVIAGL